MYINDVHILYYVVFGLIGGTIGQFIDYISKAFIKGKKIFNKENLKEYKTNSMPNYILIISMVLSYVALIYKFEIHTDIIKNIELIKYAILIPMIFCAFYVDVKEQIIPNRLNLTMFEIGLAFVCINGIININIAIDMLLGMLAGGGIFLLITLLGGLLAGKEAMGLRRCKTNGSAWIILWTK